MRLKYCNEDFCKQQGKLANNENIGKLWKGFVPIYMSIINEINADVEAIEENGIKQHGHILLGDKNFKTVKSQPLPTEIKEQVDKLMEKVQYIPCQCPDKEKWCGIKIT